MVIVPSPAARSLNIITSLRFHLSTSAPAMGLIRMVGAKKNSCTRARVVAFPVVSHAQMVRAKLVMLVPRSDMSWPTQTTVNPVIPIRVLLVSVSILLTNKENTVVLPLYLENN